MEPPPALIVYVPLITALGLKPFAVASALSVVVALIVIVVHTGDVGVGMVPLVVQWITAPAVVSDSVTVRGPVYVPGAGLNIGVAAVGVVPITYVPLATGLFANPLASAIALTVVVEAMAIGPLYGVEDVVGVLPSTV